MTIARGIKSGALAMTGVVAGFGGVGALIAFNTAASPFLVAAASAAWIASTLQFECTVADNFFSEKKDETLWQTFRREEESLSAGRIATNAGIGLFFGICTELLTFCVNDGVQKAIDNLPKIDNTSLATPAIVRENCIDVERGVVVPVQIGDKRYGLTCP